MLVGVRGGRAGCARCWVSEVLHNCCYSPPAPFANISTYSLIITALFLHCIFDEAWRGVAWRIGFGGWPGLSCFLSLDVCTRKIPRSFVISIISQFLKSALGRKGGGVGGGRWRGGVFIPVVSSHTLQFKKKTYNMQRTTVTV